MPQSNHKTLIRVLLCWAALLSVCQVALLVLFFTMGHVGKSQNKDTQESPSDRYSGRQPPSESSTAKMFTFKATKVHPNHTITWLAVETEDLPTDDGELGDLNIKKNGCFFVCLRITLVNRTRRYTEVEEVNLLKDDKEILTGWINNKTLSTGLLCKTERLFSGSKLRVQVKSKLPDKVTINVEQSLTSLDIVYMPL